MPISPTTRRLLLCEGPDDRAFFLAFTKTRNLPGFRVHYTGTPKDRAGGNSKFYKALEARYEVEGGKKFTDVLLVGDNDDNPTDSFNIVKSQVQKYFKFSPGKPREFVSGGNRLTRVKILMLPWDDEKGNLETFCFEAARQADAAMAAKVTNFQADVRADRWENECRQKEMWLRSFLAAKCQKNPFVQMQDVFGKYYEENLIPLTSSHMQRLHDELLTFAS